MNILFLDDDTNRHTIFEQGINSVHTVTHVWDVQQAIKVMSKEKFDAVFLDHDLADEDYAEFRSGVHLDSKKDGTAVALWMDQNLSNELWPTNIIIHSWNAYGANRMLGILSKRAINKVIVEPFGPKVVKLLL